MKNRSADRLIVALDFTDMADALRMARRLRGVVRTVKVSSALFTSCGPLVVKRLRRMGFEVMLDLKFFDIPSTVELSCRAATLHHVSLLTVHASGGQAMVEAALRGSRMAARQRGIRRPLVFGVTVLTSEAGKHRADVTRRVLSLAQTLVRAGGDGVVASANEVAALRERFGKQLLIICPGIRPYRSQRNDQCRIATPKEALLRGADALVVGRPITAMRDPKFAAQEMLKEMEDVTRC
jgi:orotidine-5'-phosphate decarboxylase